MGTLATIIEDAIKNSTNSDAFSHYDLRFVKPLDTQMLHVICKTHKALIIFEDGVKAGGVGSAVLEFAAQENYTLPVQLEGIPDTFINHGKTESLHIELGWDMPSIVEKISLLLNKIEG